ncbi:helix-turn-helix transcriptional regulator [Isoptericola halotolerans]|uniref:ATP/maltotriose-dependent transcriptional regulator MalT n=1 Tax=Isoptericola halotolerans TaxID=300560 RepID=A0ABX2A798_9MICO|nr:ATP/maltotriose-dependent transcriptional regulator MalT [Isoptericola halotolerans]
MRRSSQIPLISREHQVAGFRRSLDRAAAGEPGVLVVGGDAGVGKTRLVTHLAAVAAEAGGRVVVAHCVDLGEIGIPYLPFTEALGHLQRPAGAEDADDVATCVADIVAERPALARLLDPAGPRTAQDDQHAERLPLLDGVASALAAAGRPGAPLVLVIEDLHWADPSTRDVLRFLVTRLRAEHLLLVLTYRSDDVDRRHPLRPLLAELHRSERVDHVELEPFTAAELRDFTTALNDGPLTESDFAEVLRRSEGNAFFAEELVAAGLASGTLPWSLTDVLHTRMQDLDPPVQQLVRLASVAGRQVREDLLRAAAERTPGLDAATTAAALRDTVAHQVLAVEGVNLAFRHALLAEALYLDLLPGERTAMHLSYLAALLDSPDLGSAAERAHHAQQGHDLPTALAASYDAAERARDLLAPTEELRHLEQVLSLWESVPDAASRTGTDRVEVALVAAGAASRAGQPTRAVQLTRGAIESLQDDPQRQASLRHVLVRYLLDIEEDVSEASRQIDLALQVLPADPTEELASTLAVRGRIEMVRDQDDAARDFLERAVDVAHRARAPHAEADALASLAVIEVGDPETAARLIESAMHRAVDAGSLTAEMRCRYNLATTWYYAGHLDRAADLVASGLARAEETATTRSSVGISMRMIAELLRYVRGDLSAPPPRDGIPALEAMVMESAGLYAAVARGDDQVLDRTEALRKDWDVDGFVALISGGCRIDALTFAGRYDEAAALAEAVVEHLGAVWSTYFLGRIWISALALAALADAAEEAAVGGTDPRREEQRRSGDELLAVARETAERGRPRGGVLGPEGRAWLRRAEAEHARLVAATDGTPADPAVWESTVREFSYGYRYEVARSRFRWAQALRAAGDRAAAELEAAEALREARDMGAGPLADAVLAWARRARVAVPGARRETSTLTDREEQVLELVAQGLSNRQIGERLYISTKTVSVHVSNVLAKLGVSGRAEAVAVATRRGLLTV